MVLAQEASEAEAEPTDGLRPGWELMPEGAEADAEMEQTTSLKPGWDLLPDTGELDELIEDSLASLDDD